MILKIQQNLKIQKTKEHKMNRRFFLGVFGLGIGSFLAFRRQGMAFDVFGSDKKNKKEFPFQLSDEEWKKRLSPEQYRVLRKAGTERARSSKLDQEKRKGVYHCAGCDHPVFSSEAKFDSGTGWPSFYEPINDQALGYSKDYILLYPRTEEHCANCGGHLGHVFDDGPAPTGKRHCINGVALNFKPA